MPRQEKRGLAMAYSLIGKDFTPPDVHGKVTGKAKYAEDFNVDGMLYARLLTSQFPMLGLSSWTFQPPYKWKA